MKTRKNHLYRCNIDKLEITCQFNGEKVKNKLKSSQIGEENYFGPNDELKIVRKESSFYENNFRILIKDIDSNDDVVYRDFGDLFFETYNIYRQNVYIMVSNKILYNDFLSALIPEIPEVLELTFIRISKLDIAMDFNFNVIRPFNSLFKDEKLHLILNGKKVKTMQERLPNVLTLCTGSRKNPLKNRTPFIKNKNGSLEFTAYDKNKEIEESNKTYIQEKLGFDKVYRFEVRAKNYHALKDTFNFLISKNEVIDDLHLLCLLQDQRTLTELFELFVDRLFRFTYKRQKVDLLNFLLDT